jgi:hypothetical protein
VLKDSTSIGYVLEVALGWEDVVRTGIAAVRHRPGRQELVEVVWTDYNANPDKLIEQNMFFSFNVLGLAEEV